MNSKLAAVMVRCHSHTQRLMTLVCGWMLGWRWGSMLVDLVDMVLLVEEGSSSTAVAGMAPELVLWGKVGWNVSGCAAAEVAIDYLGAAAPNELSHKMTSWRSPQGRRGGRPVASSVWRFDMGCMPVLNLGQGPGSCFRV